MRAAIIIATAAALAACNASPTPEVLHRRRIVDVVSECILAARDEARAPSTFRADIDGTTIIGAPGRDPLAVRVPIRAENAMGGVVEGEALCAQRIPGGEITTAVVLR
ncbi:MAG: hypothetical protein K2X91_04135 [Thermoleophilia bacterium]|nr:hypothetical protein [Thermoleophilia bacterium]